MVESLRGDFHRQSPQAPLRIGERAQHQTANIIGSQGLQLEYARPRNQRRVHIEEGIFRSGSYQRDRAALHMRQQRVLLRFVEPVDLVDEKNCTLAVQLPPIARLRNHLPDVGDSARHGVEPYEHRVRRGGHHLGDGGLAASRGPVQDYRPQPISLDSPSQKPARPQEVALPHDVIERPRPHPRCERFTRSRAARGVPLLGAEVEKIGIRHVDGHLVLRVSSCIFSHPGFAARLYLSFRADGATYIKEPHHAVGLAVSPPPLRGGCPPTTLTFRMKRPTCR